MGTPLSHGHGYGRQTIQCEAVIRVGDIFSVNSISKLLTGQFILSRNTSVSKVDLSGTVFTFVA